jgi:hypothetical protein
MILKDKLYRSSIRRSNKRQDRDLMSSYKSREKLIYRRCH